MVRSSRVRVNGGRVSRLSKVRLAMVRLEGSGLVGVLWLVGLGLLGLVGVLWLVGVGLVGLAVESQFYTLERSNLSLA